MPKPNNKQSSTHYGMKSLDILGDKFTLGYSTLTGKFQTTLGGYITIIVTLVTVIATFGIMAQYFDRGSPVVTTSSEFGSKISKFNLYQENLYAHLAIGIGPKYLTEGMHRYITPKMRLERVIYHVSNQSFGGAVIHEFDYIPCREVTDPHMQDYIKQIVSLPGFEDILLCPDFKDFAQEFEIDDDRVTYMSKIANIRIYPCSLPDKSQCASAQEMSMLRIDYTSIKKLLVSSNFTNPVKGMLGRNFMLLDTSVTKSITYNVKNNQVIDDISQFRDPVMKAEFATLEVNTNDFQERDPKQIYCSEQQIKMAPFGGCKEYIAFEYFAKGEVFVIRRNYKKFTTILGELGGILKLVTTAAVIFYSFYGVRKVSGFLGDSLFKVDKKTGEALETRLRVMDGGEEGYSTLAKTGRKGGKKRGNRLAKVVKELVHSRSNVVDMMDKLNFVELMQGVVFDDYEQILMPLVLIVAKQRHLIEQKKAAELQRKEKSEAPNNPRRNQVFNFNNKAKKKQPESAPEGATPTYRQAYEALLSSQPEDRLKRSIKEYMLDHLSGIFEGGSSATSNSRDAPGRWITGSRSQSPFSDQVLKFKNKIELKLKLDEDQGEEGEENSPELDNDSKMSVNHPDSPSTSLMRSSKFLEHGGRLRAKDSPRRRVVGKIRVKKRLSRFRVPDSDSVLESQNRSLKSLSVEPENK